MKDMSCEQRKLLRKVSEYEFMMIDIGLYLDTHPKCPRGLAAYKINQNLHSRYKAEYEKKYGPLIMYHINDCDNKWSWVDDAWPWEVEAN